MINQVHMNFLNLYNRKYINRLRDVFGAAATIQSAEINREATYETNQMNRRIHQEDNQFNHDEAQLQREWESPEQVMKRNQAAGINPIVGDFLGTGSSPAASSAPAIPMQAPQVDYSGIRGAFSPLDIASVAAGINKTNADASLSLQQAKAVEISNTWQPDLLASQLDLNRNDANLKKATLHQIGRVSSNLMAQTWQTYMSTKMQEYQLNRDTDFMKWNVKNTALAYKKDVDFLVAELTKEVRSSTSTFDKVKDVTERTLDQLGYKTTGTNTSTSGWSVGGFVGGKITGELAGGVHAGLSAGLPNVGVDSSAKIGGEISAGVNGGYNSSGVTSQGNENSSSGEFEKHATETWKEFKSTENVRSIITAAAYARLAELPNLSKELADSFINAIKGFSEDFSSFESWFRAVGNVPNNTPSSIASPAPGLNGF